MPVLFPTLNVKILVSYDRMIDMPRLSDQKFPIIPPFPSDTPTAPLLQHSMKKLYNDDSEESNRLFQACRKKGFFRLDLRGSAGGETKTSKLRTSSLVSAKGHTAWNLDEKKSRCRLIQGPKSGKYTCFVHQRSDFCANTSYKGCGKIAPDEKGTPDRNEIFKARCCSR